ncbi:MAG: hypothetical protein K8T91_13865 [Planctomycetes bacterium]|nr:hypothetical protein [Planctomycetota bacterium]
MPKKEFRVASWFPRVLVGGVLSAMTLVVGCGKPIPPRMKSYPVRGKLLVDGKPAERADITLHPKSPLKDEGGHELYPHATVAADGTFDVQTYVDGDGAPPGEYVITVIWPTITHDGGDDLIGPDRLKNRYKNPKSPAATVVVEEHENTIPPIELK